MFHTTMLCYYVTPVEYPHCCVHAPCWNYMNDKQNLEITGEDQILKDTTCNSNLFLPNISLNFPFPDDFLSYVCYAILVHLSEEYWIWVEVTYGTCPSLASTFTFLFSLLLQKRYYFLHCNWTLASDLNCALLSHRVWMHWMQFSVN